MTAATNIYHDDTDDISEYTGEEPFDNEVSALSMRHMGEILLKGLGIIRNEKDILSALDKLNILECANEIGKARKVLASAMLLSADARKESRGAHFREDHPDTDDEFRKVTAAEYHDSTVRISFENIPERRSE